MTPNLLQDSRSEIEEGEREKEIKEGERENYTLHNLLFQDSSVNHVEHVALWCSGSMLASHARGPGFNPRAG